MGDELKISIIGAGFVGSTAAHWIAARGLGDIVLMDILEGIPQGKALDLQQAMPLEGRDIKIIGTNNYKDIKNSDVVVVAAGIPRKPGMSRDDLISVNSKIIAEVSLKIREFAPNSIVIVVTNPLDAMAYKLWKMTGFPKKRVIGMAGVLDSARFRTFIAKETGYSVKDTEALVLGGHGDTMVPLKKYTTIKGIPIKNFLNKNKIDKLIERTRNGGEEIVRYIKTGSAYFAPGRAVAEMVEAIVKDKKQLLPCSALCTGEYGVNGIFIGVPVILGSKGVEKIVELKLDEEESRLMKKTIKHVAEITKIAETY